MLFADRLEVVNSGRLPPALTVEKLRVAHQSLPGNPLLAEAMYLLRYIEKMGTGIGDMFRRCAEAGLPEPEFDVGSGFTLRIWRQGAITQKSAPTTQKDEADYLKLPKRRGRLPKKPPQLPKRRFATRSWTTCGSSPSSPGRR